MLKKVSLVLSVLATLGFAIATSVPADAKPQQGSGKSVNVNRNVNVNRTVRSGKFVVGQRYRGHIWYGHNRHRWHGRWYNYGEGPCWINVEGEWFWNVLACPI